MSAETSGKTVFTEPPAVRWALIAAAWGFFTIFLIVPLATILGGALREGIGTAFAEITDADSLLALALTVKTALLAVFLNLVFGVTAAWTVTKFEFRGRKILMTLMDLPLTVSPVISGLMLLLVFGGQGILGEWLFASDVQIIFAQPGIVLATVFVTFPYVARELIPLMQAQGNDQEEAAMTLGAGGWQAFFLVTVPNIRWGLLYGVILLNARAIGEFGAVSVVSGHIRGMTNTLPLHVEMLYNEYNLSGAFAVSLVLALSAFGTLIAKRAVAWRLRRQMMAV